MGRIHGGRISASSNSTATTPNRERQHGQHRTQRLIHIAAAALTGATFFLSGGSGAAQAANKIVARIDISDQRMEVLVDGRPTFEWKVSTAGKGYVTPTGAFKPTRLEEMWYSRKYDMSPMPHSVFFHGGYAVHATNAHQAARHAGFAWLHPAAPERRRRFLPACPGVRPVEHQHRDHRVVERA